MSFMRRYIFIVDSKPFCFWVWKWVTKLSNQTKICTQQQDLICLIVSDSEAGCLLSSISVDVFSKLVPLQKNRVWHLQKIGRFCYAQSVRFCNLARIWDTQNFSYNQKIQLKELWSCSRNKRSPPVTLSGFVNMYRSLSLRAPTFTWLHVGPREGCHICATKNGFHRIKFCPRNRTRS